ncbi:isocitrate lyase/phosphoenolpyruvate mutase family protein [Kineosporia rhizophila]|uniref:isocitrate lyase/PEP mutase family protein n=1 Tax=Kineosporia rhizophila TaxID=84633 RepID=UPI001E568F10|nr:isocitrate lyase/phosphoenolpyruvate mutase family protein [Kineosporia rhizophila]MCE0540055.1 isocitrate lyase/phosphoenolpyruvate mutase family protein [Kineosporia rhizophila]
MTSQNTAHQFAELHRAGAPVLLPNAWDAASAVLIAAAGAPAVATSSAAVAWALGKPDGEHLSRAEVAAVVARIVAAVSVPVSADIEAGYGAAPEEVASTVQAVIEAGAVGINLEDSKADGTLYPADEQAARVAAAQAAAAAAGLESFVINARTDVYLRGIGAAEGRPAEVLRRGQAYAEAGATCLFVPGLVHLPTLTDLVPRAALPISVLADPAGPTVAELAATGVVRISLGTALAEAAYGLAQAATRELLESGTMKTLVGYPGFGEVNSRFRA